MYPRLATIRDVNELGIPAQALAMKSMAEKRRAITAASELFSARIRRRYSPPLALEIDAESFTVTSAAGEVSYAGTPRGHAADVKIEIVVGGVVSGGAVTVRVSKDDGLTGTWLPTQTLPADGKLTVDGVELVFAGTFVALDSVTYTAGPSPGVRASVAGWAAWLMYGNRGGDPKAPAPTEMVKALYEEAKAFAKELAKGEEAELDHKADATPDRAELGPLFTENTRDGFRYGRP